MSSMPKSAFLAVAIAIVAFASCPSAIAQTSPTPSAQKPQHDAVLAALRKHAPASGLAASSVSKGALHQAKIAQAGRESPSKHAQRFAHLTMAHQAKASAGAAAAGKAFAALPKRAAHSLHARSSVAQQKLARKLPAGASSPKRPG